MNRNLATQNSAKNLELSSLVRSLGWQLGINGNLGNEALASGVLFVSHLSTCSTLLDYSLDALFARPSYLQALPLPRA